MKLGNRSADALAQVDLTVSNANVPTVTSPMPWDKQRRAAVRAAAMLAFAAGLLVALGAGADESARPQPTVERGRTDCHCMQPTTKQFATPISPTSTPTMRAPLTSSITCSLVHSRRTHRIPAQAPGLRAVSSDDVDREH